jgi:hypothetical protein
VLNVHGVHNVRQKDIQAAEPLVPEPRLVEVEIAIVKLKSFKSPGTDQVLAELIKVGGENYVLIYINYLFYMEKGGIATAVEGIYCYTNS